MVTWVNEIAFAVLAAKPKETGGIDLSTVIGLGIGGAIAAFYVWRSVRHQRRLAGLPKEAEVKGAAYSGPPLPPTELLRLTRAAIGPVPRNLAGTRVPLAIEPAWMLQVSDKLREVYRGQEQVLNNGKVVWAHIAQANSDLFERGDVDSPADVVYSLDPVFDAEPDALGEIAQRIFELKGTKPVDPDLRAIAKHTTDEHDRQRSMQVPPKLTGGKDVRLATIMVPRRHLPDGHLRDGLLPLLVLPDGTGWAMILPGQIWPPALVARWRGQG